MEGLMIFILVVLVLYGTGKLSKKNESRVENTIERIKRLFETKK